MTSSSILAASELDIGYGAVDVIKQLSLTVGAHELLAIVGSNGAGKSTLLKGLSGLLRIKRGDVSYRGQNVTNMRTVDLIRRGIALVPEGRMVMGPMSVLDNLKLSGIVHSRRGAGMAEIDRTLDVFPDLRKHLSTRAGSLSGGQQQMLAIARALLTRPQLMLLDEPSLGLAPSLVNGLFDSLRQLNTEGLPMILVEQNARAALSIAERACVLRQGAVTYDGDPGELASSEKLTSAYLSD